MLFGNYFAGRGRGVGLSDDQPVTGRRGVDTSRYNCGGWTGGARAWFAGVSWSATEVGTLLESPHRAGNLKARGYRPVSEGSERPKLPAGAEPRKSEGRGCGFAI